LLKSYEESKREEGDFVINVVLVAHVGVMSGTSRVFSNKSRGNREENFDTVESTWKGVHIFSTVTTGPGSENDREQRIERKAAGKEREPGQRGCPAPGR
jgi:hypothetical protein